MNRVNYFINLGDGVISLESLLPNGGLQLSLLDALNTAAGCLIF